MRLGTEGPGAGRGAEPARAISGPPSIACASASKRAASAALGRPLDPVHRFGVMGKTFPAQERIAQQTRQLLARHGVVTRERWRGRSAPGTGGRSSPPAAAGDARRGAPRVLRAGAAWPAVRFTRSRRAAARDPRQQRRGSELVVLNACDPANLYGPAHADGPQTAQSEPLTFARVRRHGWCSSAACPCWSPATGSADLTVAGRR